MLLIIIFRLLFDNAKMIEFDLNLKSKREMQSLHKRPDNAELAIEIRNINRSHSLLAESNFITFINLRKWHCLHIVFFMQITLLRFFLLLIVKNLIQC